MMKVAMIDLVRELCSLNDDNLAERVIKDSDVQWCLSELLDILEQEEKQNEPLTLEELREMNGEPVWVKRLKGLSVCDTDWAVVEFRLEPDVKHYEIRVWWPGSEYEDTPSEDDYGKTWMAYRRPPEGEEEI